ncbi:aminotransferase class I/II-fold pyridoxal phosphate-dependent enzyme [Paraburkholderia sp. J67]|uniref:aminotransferase class I/II-fold pyridoxal phosphate-dependent enzyme n=1 Tax=Paraburkholderia sp. J67 TaxID=2805435 RepID=UPI002ABE25A8|nr:aminotransferase class I/II-fold pyridoxal phosphate-dependent enzyme [Paraburkholderia sp. J67]
MTVITRCDNDDTPLRRTYIQRRLGRERRIVGLTVGIYVAARVLIRPGDCVVVEELTYPPAREAFRVAGAEIVTVGLDANGLKVDEL